MNAGTTTEPGAAAQGGVAQGSVAQGSVGEAVRHDSAHLHVSGAAAYTDDILELRGTLHAACGLSARAHARIVAMDLSAVRAAPGVVAVLTAADLRGENNVGPVLKDEPLLASGTVEYLGQPVFAVAARTVDQARRAARLAKVEYQDLPAILDIDAALAAGAFVLPTRTLERGDATAALAVAPHRLSGRLQIGGQEQFYLEGQVAYAIPGEDGQMLVHSSNQHPGEAQLLVAHALGVDAHKVSVECRRMGGGFGGKETQAAPPACIAAVLAQATGHPVKYRLDRDDDMMVTGKRHDFRVDWQAGFTDEGVITALDMVLASRCGISADLSGPVNDRAMMHADNCYFLANVCIVSHRCKTNMQSATAFRGFGGPQGMMATENVIDEVARHLGLDPLEVRKRNFYVPGVRDEAPYRQKVTDFVMHEMVAELERTSDYAARREAIRRWNAGSPVIKRGIALTPLKFGISFTSTMLNQAGALVHIYTDGTVMLNHGGTEMGQGLFTKVAQVVAHEFGIDIGRVRITASDTARVPNASATAASSGSDLNGMAAMAACRELKSRLAAVAGEHLGVAPDAVRFEGGRVLGAGSPASGSMSFGELAKMAWMKRVSLSATGFHRTPGISYDPRTLCGKPFYYYSYGAAVSEVAIDTLTGEMRLLRADILQDVGKSLNPALDRGQVEGGFVQGMGWLTAEELVWDARGALRTHAPSTYKIPVAGDIPADFRVSLWAAGRNTEENVRRSKAVGEPPLMLGMSVFHAVRDAVAASGGYVASPCMDAPATPEQILRSVDELRARAVGKAAS